MANGESLLQCECWCICACCVMWRWGLSKCIVQLITIWRKFTITDFWSIHCVYCVLSCVLWCGVVWWKVSCVMTKLFEVCLLTFSTSMWWETTERSSLLWWHLELLHLNFIIAFAVLDIVYSVLGWRTTRWRVRVLEGFHSFPSFILYVMDYRGICLINNNSSSSSGVTTVAMCECIFLYVGCDDELFFPRKIDHGSILKGLQILPELQTSLILNN